MSHCCRPKTVKKLCKPSERRGNPSLRVNNITQCCLPITMRNCLHAQKPAQIPTEALAFPFAHCHRSVAPRDLSSSYSDGPYRSGHGDPSYWSSHLQLPRCRPKIVSLHGPSHCAVRDMVAID